MNGGALLVNGSLAGGSAVTVAVAGTLGGTGTIGGAVAVNGTLTPGTSIGTLTCNSSVTLASNVIVEINRTNAVVSDKLVVGGTLTYGGRLTVTNLGPDLQKGDTFPLFTATTRTGTFTATNLPPLPPGLGLYWGTDDNYATISVQGGPPAITQQPQSGTIGQGNYFPLCVTASGAPAYQWRFNGVDIAGATGDILVFSSLDPTNAGNYDVVVTNAYGGVTSTVATITVVAHGYVITPLSATASSSYVDKTPTDLINGSALSGSPILAQTHGNSANGVGMWHSSGGTINTNYLTFDLGTVGYLTGVNIWQMNQAALLGRGVKDFGVFVATNADDPVASYVQVGNFTMRRATGTSLEHLQYFPFAANGVRMVMLAISNCWSGAANEYVGLSEVRFEGTTAPGILQQPAGGLAYAWSTFTLSVTAIGDQIRYQWYKDNALLPNFTNGSFTINPVLSPSGGDYFVTVSNYVGVITSTVASVIYTNPVNLSDALFVHYTFDESSGTAAADSSGRGNNGTLNYFPTNNSAWVQGRLGGALEFSRSGTNDLTYVLTDAALTFTNSDLFTYAFWARANSTSLNNPRFAAPLGGTHWLLWKPGTGVGFWSAVPATTQPEQSVWHHFAATYNRSAGTYTVYVDGLVKATGSGGGRADPGSVQWIIGHGESLGDNVDTFRGRLDDLRIYNRNLYPGEIKALYDLAGPPAPTVDTQPVGGLRLPGDAFTFSVGVEGPAPWSFQWWKESTLLDGATNRSLTLSNLVLADSGSYSVVVTNIFGSVTSAPAMLTVTNPPVDIASDLRLWYPIMTADGTGLLAADYTGNVNDGGLQGFVGDDSQWVEGRVELGLRFQGNNGSNQVVLVQDQSTDYPPGSLDFAANAEFTLAAWVMGSAAQETSAGLIAKGNGGGGEQYAIDIEGGVFRFFVRAASGTATEARSSIRPNGTWQHVVAVYSRTLSRMKLYVNGAEVASATPFATGLLTNSHDISFGSRQASNADYDLNFSGVLDDVRIYARAFTPADVSALYYDAPAEAPSIAQQPANIYVVLTNSATLSVVAGGTVPLSYQWMKGAAAVLNATNASFTITNAQLSDDADYTVVVTNLVGRVTSAVAHVSVASFLDLRTAPVVASSQYSANYPPANAFDGKWMGNGNDPNRWASGMPSGAPQWIYVDLGQTYLIRHVFVDYDPAWPVDCTLRVRSAAEGPTSNPNDWHPVASVAGYGQNEPGIDGADMIFDFQREAVVLPGNINTAPLPSTTIQSGGVYARYLMLNATVFRPGYSGMSVWEMRVDATVVPLVTLSGQVTLEGNVAASRTVQFSCTDNAISTALPQTLAFSGETANYTLVAPASAVRVSAKSAWHLRQTVTPAFINNEATVNFALSAGDLNGSNRVDLEDYYLLAAAWYLPNAGADIDGNGVVDLDDYFLLANHWLSDGQAE